MLNKVILMGRITQDLDLRTTPTGVSVLTFNIAVDRGYVKQGEERQADFITCVAWRQQAEFINRYFAKGRMIAIEGSLRTRTYEDKNGSKHHVTEVYVDNVSFTGEKATQGDNSYSSNYKREAPVQSRAYEEQPALSPITIGDAADFEEIISDDGVPF